MKRPSGDNDGSNSGQGDRVRRLSWVPSASTDQTSWKSSKTIRPESDVRSIGDSARASLDGDMTPGDPAGPSSAAPEQLASKKKVRRRVVVRIPLLNREQASRSVRAAQGEACRGPEDSCALPDRVQDPRS